MKIEIIKRWTKDIAKLQENDSSLKRITFHGFRHSCASWLMYNGVNLKIIQETRVRPGVLRKHSSP
jgi:integrase